jgi:hypothetical protein
MTRNIRKAGWINCREGVQYAAGQIRCGEPGQLLLGRRDARRPHSQDGCATFGGLETATPCGGVYSS